MNPNGSTVVNVYYDRDLMTVTYHYTSAQVSNPTSAGGYAYIRTTSNTGEQYGYINGQYQQIFVTENKDDVTYLFPYRYTASTAQNTGMYGVVGGTYVPLTRETRYRWIKSGYVYTPVTPPTSGTNQYAIKNGDFLSLTTSNNNFYYNNNDNKWYRIRNWRLFGGYTYSDEVKTAYTRANYTGGEEYSGTRYVLSDNSYTATTGTSGTQYGIDAAKKLYQLSYSSYYAYTYNGQDYEGARYTTSSDNTVYTGTVYKKSGNSFVAAADTDGEIYGLRNDVYEELNKSVNTTYTWKTADGTVYNGTRYLRFENSGVSGYPYQVVWTGLFMQDYAVYGYGFPSEYLWNEQSDGSGTTQTLLSGFSITENEAANTDYHLYCRGAANTGTLYHLRQRLDGTYSIDDTAYYDIAHVSSGSVSFKFSDKFYGYHVCGYSTSFDKNGNGKTNINDGQTASLQTNSYTYYVYHEGESELELTFNENYGNNKTYTLKHLKYQQPIGSYSTAYTPTPQPYYEFTGWYEDESCTKEFNFNTTITASKIIYAGWKKLRYRVTVDPDGGVFDFNDPDGNNGGNFSTFFKIDYAELITPYDSTKRNYVEDPVNGDYLYVNVRYDLVEKMLDKNTGNPLDLDAAFRKAFYVQKNSLEDIYRQRITYKLSGEDKTSSFEEQGMSLEDFKKCVDMETLYSSVQNGNVEYRLVSWHKVREDGTLEQTPFNFKSIVSEDIHLRARWMRIGKYSLTYNPTMKSTGITGTMARYFDPLDTDRKFSDKSPVIVLQEPTALKLPNGSEASEYVFRGWRIVDGKNGAPLENEVFYDPGDTMILDARMADNQGVIHMEAYYEKKESTVRRVDVTSLTLDADAGEKGVVNNQGLRGDKYEQADIAKHQIKIDRQLNNFGVDLKKYIKNFSHTDGHFLLGWDTFTPQGDYIPEFYADAFIGVNKNDMPNTLYAVWEPMVYLHLQNKTSYPVTFELKFDYNGTVYEGHANKMTGEYERQAFSDDANVQKKSAGDFEVILPVGADIQLVLPEGVNSEGAGATYTITGSYIDETTARKTLIIFNSGDAQTNTISYNSGSKKWQRNNSGSYTSAVPYTTSGTLVNGIQGRTVLFTEENPRVNLALKARYYDTEANEWTDENEQTGAQADIHFTNLPAGVQEAASDDGVTTGVQLFYGTETSNFGVKVNTYNEADYKFIGWYTTGSAVPNTFTIDGKANDFGEKTVTGLTVPPDPIIYYALFVPYVRGTLTITHTERADTAGHCADGDGLKLKIENTTPGASNVWEAAGDWQTPASVTLPADFIDEKNTDGTFTVTVSALPHEGSVYKTTYRDGVEVQDVTRNETGYSYAVYHGTVAKRFADSETVKGLKVLNTIKYESNFTRGYEITYHYSARDGSQKTYVLKGDTDTFEDFSLFVMEHTPYERNLTGDIVWDTQNMVIKTDDFGMKAELNEKPTIREKCSVTIIEKGGYTPVERVEYGTTFSDEQAARHIPPTVNDEGKQFAYWDVTNTKTGEHIANCYSDRFTFEVWNNYTITPVYEENPTQKKDEGTFVTVDYIETSRNQWGSASHSDDGTVTDDGFTDKIVADMDISFIDGDRQILTTLNTETGEPLYRLGVFFEYCGKTEDGTFDKAGYQALEDTTTSEKRVRAILNVAKDVGSGTFEGVACYYSRINISENTVSTFNRSEFARSFNTSAVKNRVFRMYAYMVTPENRVVLSNPQYISFFEYAAPATAVY